jgi:hypothetical protein
MHLREKEDTIQRLRIEHKSRRRSNLAQHGNSSARETHHVSLRAALVAVHRLEGVLVVQPGLNTKHNNYVHN